MIVMVQGDCCFYVYCVNAHFHREKVKTHFQSIVINSKKLGFKGVLKIYKTVCKRNSDYKY